MRIALIALVAIIGIGSNPFAAHALDNDYNWTKLGYADAYPSQSATSFDGQDSIVAGDTVAISHDKAQTWQTLNDTLAAVPGNTKTNWYKNAVMSSNGQIAGVVNANGQLFISTDSGVTWLLTPTPMNNVESITMSADGTKLAAATGSAIYTSSDGGTTWVERADGSTASAYYKVVVMSGDGQKLLASTEDNDYSSGPDGGIYQSVDGGVTWTQNASTEPLGLYNIKLSSNGQIAIAQSYDGAVQLSADGGSTWSQVHAAPVTGDTFDMFVSADGSTVLVFDGYTRFKSTNHGLSWTTQTANRDVWVRGSPGSSSADLSVIVSGESDYGDLFASQDSGITWKIPLFEGSKWWASMATTTDGSTVLLTDADGHIYYSHDHGTTWNFGYDALDDSDATGGDLWGTAVSTDGSHMVVTDDASTAHLLTSSDGGVTWTRNAAAGAHDWYDVALSADGSKIAAITASGDVYLSNNFGTTWTVLTTLEHNFPTTGGSSVQMKIAMSPDGTQLAVSEDGLTTSYNSGWVYTGTNYIYTSADGGASWSQRATPVDSGSVSIQDLSMSSDAKTLAFVTYGSNSHLYLSKDGGGTWAVDPGTGLPAGGPAYDYNQVSMSSNGQAIAVSDFGHENTYVTTDGGATWKTYSNNDPDGSGGSGVVATAVSGDGTQIYVATNNIYRGALAGTNTGGSSSSNTLPSAPQQTVVTPTSATGLKVSWQAPLDEGSSPVTTYRIRYRVAGAANWVPAGEVNASTLSYTISSLSPTTTYEVQVAAVSALGASTDVPAQASDAIATATTLKPGQAAPGGDLADTGANIWLFGSMGISTLAVGATALKRFSKR